MTTENDPAEALRALRFRASAEAIRALITHATRSKMSPAELCLELATLDKRERDQRNLAARTKDATLGPVKPLDRFDWSHPRQIDRELFEDNAGYDLVTISDSAENEWLNAQQLERNIGTVWAGYSNMLQEGTWKWADNTLVGYSKWSTGKPNNYGGVEDCAEMRPNGFWNDLNCASTLQFVCESATNPTTSILVTYDTSGTNTVNHDIYLYEGQVIILGTCGLDGVVAMGDTSLRLIHRAEQHRPLLHPARRTDRRSRSLTQRRRGGRRTAIPPSRRRSTQATSHPISPPGWRQRQGGRRGTCDCRVRSRAPEGSRPPQCPRRSPRPLW